MLGATFLFFILYLVTMLGLQKTAHSLVAGSVDLPKTPGQRDEGWGPPLRQRHCTSGPFDLSTGSPAHAMAPPADIRPRQQTRSVF
jgi:E3 ubiquitin-protein ligase CCNP1IP1